MSNDTLKQLEMPLFEVRIPLSKTGKYKGQYEALVSPEDAEYVMQFNWVVFLRKYTQYALYPSNGKANNSGKTMYMHRVILSRMLKRELKRNEDVDHINGNGLDNRRENLRLASRSQNLRNQRKRSDNTSGYKGVCYNKRVNKWVSLIKVGKKRINLGYFDDPETAYAAYCEAADKYFKDFKNDGDK